MNSNFGIPLIVAHRGASAIAPENTFAAFQKAVEAEADGIEFDVRLTKDAVPIVFHDATLKRLAGREINVSTLDAKELTAFDVGSWFNRKNPNIASENFAAEKIPTFAETLRFFENYRGLLYVELKGSDREIFALTEAVCRLIKESELLPQIIVKSFNLKCLPTAKKFLPDLRTAALFEPEIPTILRKRKYILEKAKLYRADEISLHYSLVTKKFVEAARQKNFPLTVWTIDKPSWIKRALDLQINALITNDPALLLAKRREILPDI